MKYRIAILDDSGDTLTLTEVASIESDRPSPEMVQRLKAELFTTTDRVVAATNPAEGAPASVQRGATRGRKAKSLYILSVDDINVAPSGIAPGVVVQSSMELSQMLGYNFNMVIQAFAKARSKLKVEANKLKSPHREIKLGERLECSLRGVHFCYTDDIGETE